MNVKLQPGYKQTEVGVIPEDWTVQSVGELCKVNQGLQIAINNRLKIPSVNSKKYITIQYLNEGKEVEYIDTYSSAVCCNQNDILMTRTGNTGLVITNVEGVFHNNFFKINYNKKRITKEYFINFLSLGYTQKQIMIKAGTSTIPDLNHNDFYSIYIAVPSISEQTAIANTLSDADALIESLEQLIAKKRKIKQGAMQELLRPKEGWIVKRLGEICEIRMGRTPARLNSFFWGRGYKWLSIADLQTKIVSDSKEEITELAASEMQIIQKGTLLMSFKLSLGRLCFAGCDLFTNEAICSFNKLQINADFLYYVLGRTDFSLYGKQAVKGYTLNKESLKLIEIFCPSPTEQTAIAAILSDMDNEITALETKLTKARQIKQGMMHNLLTGRIRLI